MMVKFFRPTPTPVPANLSDAPLPTWLENFRQGFKQNDSIPQCITDVVSFLANDKREESLKRQWLDNYLVIVTKIGRQAASKIPVAFLQNKSDEDLILIKQVLGHLSYKANDNLYNHSINHLFALNQQELFALNAMLNVALNAIPEENAEARKFFIRIMTEAIRQGWLAEIFRNFTGEGLSQLFNMERMQQILEDSSGVSPEHLFMVLSKIPDGEREKFLTMLLEAEQNLLRVFVDTLYYMPKEMPNEGTRQRLLDSIKTACERDESKATYYGVSINEDNTLTLEAKIIPPYSFDTNNLAKTRKELHFAVLVVSNFCMKQGHGMGGVDSKLHDLTESLSNSFQTERGFQNEILSLNEHLNTLENEFDWRLDGNPLREVFQ